jgi:hypothetical protein
MFSLLTRVGLANFITVNYTVTTLHIGRIFFQMGGADILQTICFGAAMPAFNGGIVGNSLETLFQTLHFKAANMHLVSFNVTVHCSSIAAGAPPVCMNVSDPSVVMYSK